MHRFIDKFVIYCEQELDFEKSMVYGYKSLSVCIIDCVYSLRARYYETTIPVVDRYAEYFMEGNKYSSGDTVSMLIENIDGVGGTAKFADLLTNHQKIGGKIQIPKAEVCYQLAKYLKYLHIDTIEEFREFESPELLEIVIRAVKGMGNAGVNYLFMLTGDSDRCKPDVHLHHCITDACGCDVSDEECQILLTDAVKMLNSKYPNMTVRDLDGVIWNKYRDMKK
mgnify:FL=1